VYGGFDNWAVSVSGTLGVVTGNLLGLKVMDVSSLTAPRALATMTGVFTGVAMGSQYAYVLQTIAGNPAHIDLVVLDLRTPSAPAIAGRVTVAGGSQLALVGSVAYVAAAGAGLQVIDVSSPTAPRIIGSVDTPGNAHAVAVSGSYAYVADETALIAISVATPSAPVILGTLTTSAIAIAVSGTRVYAVDGMQLKIVDVTNPAAPALLSTSTAYGAQAIDVWGTVACLATAGVSHLDTSGGLYVLDVSNATSPRLVTQVIVPGTTRSVEAGSGLFFAGDTAALLDVVRY